MEAPKKAPKMPVTTGEHIRPHVDPAARTANDSSTPSAAPIPAVTAILMNGFFEYDMFFNLQEVVFF